MTGDEMTDQKVVCHFSVLHFPLPHNCFSLYVIVQTVRKDKAVGPSGVPRAPASKVITSAPSQP